MRRSTTTTAYGSRALSLNSFLISLILNLALLLILSLYREHTVRQSRDAILVEFTRLPKTMLKRRPLITLPRSLNYISQPMASIQTSVRTTKKIEPSHSDSQVLIGIDPTDDLSPDAPSSIAFERRSAFSMSDFTDDWKRGDSVSSRPTRLGAGGRTAQVDRRIVPRQPKAIITGSGDKLSGYYNISLVKYEDTSDVISAGALTQLAGAMNRWTEIRTKVIKEPLMLDDPELLQVPLVYITSRRPFAFSERERKNLQRYFASGGFLLFSNAADSDSEARGVANSIEFELWKVLSGVAHDLVDIGKEHQVHKGFFDLSNSLKLRGVILNGRMRVIYEDSGYGNAWRSGKDDKRKPYLKLGVNIIVYALTTSPMVQ